VTRRVAAERIDDVLAPTVGAPSPGSTEARLADIWSAVLGVDEVQPDDDFFRLGGQSLLAMQVAVRVRDEFGVELLLPRLFELRTLAAVAAELESSRGRGHAVPPIVHRGKQRGPVSISQRSMLVLRDSDLVPVVSPVFRLSGGLDVRALEAALNELVRRHEILRTVYRSVLGRDRQVVLPWSFTPLDAGAPATGARDRQGRDPWAVVADDMVTTFDLADGPLVRWRLQRLGKGDHLLSVVVHEIAADGWSVPVILGELSALYNDLAAGRPPSLPEPPVQYLDFVHWQRTRVTRKARRSQLRYWKSRLADAPLSLDLVPDQWPETFDAPVARAAELHLDRDLVDRLWGLARDEGATLFMVMVAALQALLHRYTGSPHVLLRPTFANRTTAQVEGIPGFFVNFLLLDTDVSGDPSFGELVERARRDLLDATVHADVQLSDVLQRVAAMKTARKQWPAGLLRFQLFNFPNTAGLSLDGVRAVREQPRITATDHFALAGTENTDGSLSFVLHYDGSRFGRTAMERLLARYRGVLEQVAVSPGIRVSALTLLDRRDVNVVRRAGRGPAPVSPFVPVATSAWEQAARTPEAVAVAHRGDDVSYAQLAHWAGAASAALSTPALAPEAPVVVLASGAAMAAGVLGVLDAGGLCVPVDPALPKDVVAAVVAHARPVAVLADAAALPTLPRTAPPAVLLEDLRSAEATAPRAATAVAPGQAAMAVYSFGRHDAPRAAVHTHAGLAQVVSFVRAVANLRGTDRVAELPAPLVGRLAWARLASLAAGATYVVADEAPPDPVAWLLDRRVTVCIGDGPVVKACATSDAFVKAPLRLLLSDEPVAAPEGRCRIQLAEVASVPGVAGPWAVGNRPRSEPAPAFTGTPTGGVEAFVVDSSSNLAPPLVPGELCLDGAAVARELIHDARATALALVPNPFSDRPGARMLRTGLIARVDDRQCIEVLGEGEGPWFARGLPMGVYLRRIEAAVRRLPAVGSVVARVEEMAGELRVALYVVPCAGARVSAREVRAAVPRDVPPPAQPLTVKVLDRFPRCPDGRVDTGALGKG
jgi:non-ribosomal peptide synthetase component F/acyl carrier protein